MGKFLSKARREPDLVGVPHAVPADLSCPLVHVEQTCLALSGLGTDLFPLFTGPSLIGMCPVLDRVLGAGALMGYQTQQAAVVLGF